MNNLNLKDYDRADIGRIYFYTLRGDEYTEKEHRAESKAELEAAIQQGKVFSFRVVTSHFYFLNKDGQRKWNKKKN